MSGRIVIFGYGPIGRATAERLIAEGRDVVVAQRNPPADLSRGATYSGCDALDRDSVVKTAREGEQFVVAIGFPYVGRVWREAWPKAIGNFVAAAEATGARLVFIDNLYMYGRQTAPLVESMPLTSFGLKPAARAAATRVWKDAPGTGPRLLRAGRRPVLPRRRDDRHPGEGQAPTCTTAQALGVRPRIRVLPASRWAPWGPFRPSCARCARCGSWWTGPTASTRRNSPRPSGPTSRRSRPACARRRSQ